MVGLFSVHVKEVFVIYIFYLQVSRLLETTYNDDLGSLHDDIPS